MSRRRLLGLAAGVGVGVGVGAGIGIGVSGIGTAEPTLPRGPAGSRTDPVSMAMHIHACFSEGTASMQAHLHEAQRNGIDVIWWTEHDFRMRAHGYRQEVHFDGLTELENGVDWTWREARFGQATEALASFVSEPRTPTEPGNALLMRLGADSPDWAGISYEGDARNSTYTTCLIDTTIELDVLAQSVGRDAELVVEIVSSYRPATAGRPAGQYALQYRVGAGGGRALEMDGLLGVMPVQVRPGWQRLRLRPVDDIAALWPDLVAGDSGLFRLRLLARARSGATAAGVFDRLRFIRAGRADPLDLQRELVREYSPRYPGVRQIQSAEISLVRHLNTFGGDLSLPDYGSGPAVRDNAVSAAEAMVKRVHGYGGIASYNHPLSGTAKELASHLVATRNMGADAVEVGYRQDVEQVSYAFDVAARNAVFVTATGVTDDHSGLPWANQRTRWISSVWAPSTETADLVRGIGAGRLWFWDLGGWGGTFDINVHGKAAMGGVLVTGERRVAVDVLATDLPGDGSLDLVVGQVDRAGPDVPKPATTVFSRPARQVRGGRASIDLRPGRGQYLRAAVRDRAGSIVGYSNPLWILPDTSASDVPPDRQV
ncbi:MAG: hypothetical protein WCB04_03240 [Mycobacteriales bacterium]